MFGLFASELILFAAAALAGFAVGWRLHLIASRDRRLTAERDVEELRAALSEAQVRRARAP